MTNSLQADPALLQAIADRVRGKSPAPVTQGKATLGLSKCGSDACCHLGVTVKESDGRTRTRLCKKEGG